MDREEMDQGRPVTGQARLSGDFDYGDVDHRHPNRVPAGHSPGRRLPIHTGHYRRSISPPQLWLQFTRILWF